MQELRELSDRIITLEEKFKAVRRASADELLECLAASGVVSIITIQGYTPGFNDGEPCRHSSRVYVNIQDHLMEEVDETGELERLFEQIPEYPWGKGWSDEERAAAELVCEAAGHQLVSPPPEVYQAISVVLKPVIEAELGTNYYVVYTLKKGRFERQVGDYDCGY